MKKKTLTLISSCAAIAVCSSLIVGSTYALFSSEDKVDIAVTAGKVAVTAEVVDTSLELTSMGEVMPSTNWENGGTAGFTSAKKLELNGITPGDGATFDIKVTNESTVNIKYRLKWSVEGKLGEALEASANGAELNDWNDWAIPVKAKDKELTVSVNISLPAEYDDVYGTERSVQGEKATVTFTVEAIQGNAEAPGETVVKTEEEFRNAVTYAEDNAVIVLANDVALTSGFAPGTLSGKTITIKGAKQSVALDVDKYTVVFGGANVKYKNITLTADAANSAYNSTYWYCMFGALHTNNVEYINCIFPSGVITYNSGVATFRDCKFSSNERNEGKYTLWYYAGTELNVVNCEFDNAKGYGMKIYSEDNNLNGIANISGCVFNADGTSKKAIEIDSTYSTYTVNVTDCEYSGSFVGNHYAVSGANATVIETSDSDIYTLEQFNKFTNNDLAEIQDLAENVIVTFDELDLSEIGNCDLSIGVSNTYATNNPDKIRPIHLTLRGNKIVGRGGSEDAHYTNIDDLNNYEEKIREYNISYISFKIPGGSDISVEVAEIQGAISFNFNIYTTTAWSIANSMKFNNCTFNGLVVNYFSVNELEFNNCTFNAPVNSSNTSSSSPVWARPQSASKVSMIGCDVKGGNPVKFENYKADTEFYFEGNTFDMYKIEGVTDVRDYGLLFNGSNIAKMTLKDNTVVNGAGLVAMYKATITVNDLVEENNTADILFGEYKTTTGLDVVSGS